MSIDVDDWAVYMNIQEIIFILQLFDKGDGDEGILSKDCRFIYPDNGQEINGNGISLYYPGHQ